MRSQQIFKKDKVCYDGKFVKNMVSLRHFKNMKRK